MTGDTTDTETIRYYLSRVEQVEDELYQHSERLEDLYQHELAAYIGDLANTLHETRYEIAQIIKCPLYVYGAPDQPQDDDKPEWA